MTTQPALATPVVGFPSSAAYLTAQLYNPLKWLYDNASTVWFHEGIVTATSSVNNTTEAIVLTTAPILFKAGRAYKVSLKCAVNGTVANDQVTVRLRSQAVNGDIFIEIPRVVIIATGTANELAESQVIAANNGPDVTRTLNLTLTRVTGSGTIIVNASTAAYVGHILVEDIGTAANVTNARAIT